MTRTRFPRSVFRVGTEPDARFTLANERTFLAWTRTALALIAGGVALEALGLDLQAGFRLAASLVLVVAGLALPIWAWVEWMRTERALRPDAPHEGQRHVAPRERDAREEVPRLRLQRGHALEHRRLRERRAPRRRDEPPAAEIAASEDEVVEQLPAAAAREVA